MNALAILRALWPALRRILVAIGRWVLDALADEGLRGLISYMRQRVKVFRRRLKRRLKRRRKPKLLIKFVRGRISRWCKAVRWLQGAEAKKLKGKVLKFAIDEAERRIPEESPLESYGRWKRRQNRRAA